MMPDAELLYSLSLAASAAANLVIIYFAVEALGRQWRGGLAVLCGAATVGVFLSLAYWVCGATAIFMSGHPAIYGSLFLMDIGDSVLYAVGVGLVVRGACGGESVRRAGI